MVLQASINYLAVLVAAVVAMVIGGLWYSPLLFRNLWMRLAGKTTKDLEKAKQKGMGKLYLLAFIAALVTSYVLAHFVDYLEATTISSGMTAGFWLWLGFIATTTLNSVLWEGKSFKLYILNNAHLLLNLLVMGAILAVWT